MLATREIEGYALHSRAAWKRFCDDRGYRFFHYGESLLPDMHVNWSKIEMVRRHLSETDAEIVVLVDADTYVCSRDFDLNALAEKYADKDILFAKDCHHLGPFLLPLNFEAAFKYQTRNLPNAGFVVIRNNDFCRQFFDDWLSLSQGQLSGIADRHPRNQRVLWQGLYFKHMKRIGLLDRIVERVRNVAHIPRAIRSGAAVVHVKNGLSQQQADELEVSLRKNG
ncbi:hypothetical protein [Anderseniella sp. Alg231-50]|uniref:hypothetical protein n=1 Tax=Anderseniella sp. Alg231-50 TaxID=1922226 RepID=UPI00307B86C9